MASSGWPWSNSILSRSRILKCTMSPRWGFPPALRQKTCSACRSCGGCGGSNMPTASSFWNNSGLLFATISSANRLGYAVRPSLNDSSELACFPSPNPPLNPNTSAYESEPMVKATGFREYDARWLFGSEINLMGIEALGLGLGALIHELGVEPRLVTGHDFRSYSASIKMALTNGLLAAGCKVSDIGLALTPMAYFAQFDLDVPCVAMVTASLHANR